MPLPKRCHNHLCRVLISRFEHEILPSLPPGSPSWIFFAKGCIGICLGLQKYCKGLAQNRSLTSLSISVLRWSFPFPATRIFTTSAGAGRTGLYSWDHWRCNEHPLLATIVHCSLLLSFFHWLLWLTDTFSKAKARLGHKFTAKCNTSMIKNHTTLKKLHMVWLLFIYPWCDTEGLNQRRFCQMDKESSSSSMFHHSWKAFDVPSTPPKYVGCCVYLFSNSQPFPVGPLHRWSSVQVFWACAQCSVFEKNFNLCFYFFPVSSIVANLTQQQGKRRRSHDRVHSKRAHVVSFHFF